MNTAGRCGAAYIYGGRKFSASLENGQNDSSRHIIASMIFCIRVTRGIVSALGPIMQKSLL